MTDFHERYRAERGHWAWHVTPAANLASIVQHGLDARHTYQELGVGGSRPGRIYLSARQPSSSQWALLRVSVEALDPQLVEPDDDAIGHLGFDEHFGDEADEVLSSWGYTEQGEWVAQQAAGLTPEQNLAILLSHGDFAYAGRIDPTCIDVQVDGHWRALHSLLAAGEEQALASWAAQQAISQLEVIDLDGRAVDQTTMRDPVRSKGTCAAASRALEATLRARGIDAHLVEGLDPHTASGEPHVWVEAELGAQGPWGSPEGRRVMIDLTAAQFGQQRWPLVRSMGVDEHALGEVIEQLSRPNLAPLHDAPPPPAQAQDGGVGIDR